MNTYRTLEVAGSVIIGLLAAFNFRVALLHTEPIYFTVVNIIAGVFFYPGSPMLILIGCIVHSVWRKSWGRIMLLIGGVLLIGISILFMLIPFPPSRSQEQLLLIVPGGIALIPMLLSFVKADVASAR
jgi:hypothetical protein